MPYKSTIELFKEDMKFSAGHFTVFSATERERLHGHNFRVRASVTVEVGDEGMAADYKVFKNKFRTLCDSLDEYFLIPEKSKHLIISKPDTQRTVIKHAEDELVFLDKDIKLLPITNTTVEEFARYLTLELAKEHEMIEVCKISAIEVKVGSGDGQYASYLWETKNA